MDGGRRTFRAILRTPCDASETGTGISNTKNRPNPSCPSTLEPTALAHLEVKLLERTGQRHGGADEHRAKIKSEEQPFAPSEVPCLRLPSHSGTLDRRPDDHKSP